MYQKKPADKEISKKKIPEIHGARESLSDRSTIFFPEKKVQILFLWNKVTILFFLKKYQFFLPGKKYQKSLRKKKSQIKILGIYGARQLFLGKSTIFPWIEVKILFLKKSNNFFFSERNTNFFCLEKVSKKTCRKRNLRKKCPKFTGLVKHFRIEVPFFPWKKVQILFLWNKVTILFFLKKYQFFFPGKKYKSFFLE